MASSDFQLRTRLQRYVLGTDDLRAFQRWFATFVWRAGSDGTMTPLSRAVERYLAEYTNGHRSEPELRTLFASRLAPGPLVFDQSEVERWELQEPTYRSKPSGVV